MGCRSRSVLDHALHDCMSSFHIVYLPPLGLHGLRFILSISPLGSSFQCLHTPKTSVAEKKWTNQSHSNQENKSVQKSQNKINTPIPNYKNMFTTQPITTAFQMQTPTPSHRGEVSTNTPDTVGPMVGPKLSNSTTQPEVVVKPEFSFGNCSRIFSGISSGIPGRKMLEPTVFVIDEDGEQDDEAVCDYECSDCNCPVNGLDIRCYKGQCGDCFRNDRQCDGCNYFANNKFGLFGHEHDVQLCQACYAAFLLQEATEAQKKQDAKAQEALCQSPVYSPTSPAYDPARCDSPVVCPIERSLFTEWDNCVGEPIPPIPALHNELIKPLETPLLLNDNFDAAYFDYAFLVDTTLLDTFVEYLDDAVIRPADQFNKQQWVYTSACNDTINIHIMGQFQHWELSYIDLLEDLPAVKKQVILIVPPCKEPCKEPCKAPCKAPCKGKRKRVDSVEDRALKRPRSWEEMDKQKQQNYVAAWKKLHQ